MKEIREAFEATIVDPYDREYLVQLRSMLISSLVLMEKSLGLPVSVLTRERRRKIEQWAGITIEEILSDKGEVT